MNKHLNRIVIANIAAGIFLWIASLIIAGLREYEYSAWVIPGMFLPGALFYFLKRSGTITRLIVFLNLGCLYYTGMEALTSKFIYVVIFLIPAALLLFTSWELFKSIRDDS